MSRQEHLDILVMRGAGQVQRLRFRAGWLHALWLTPVLFVVLVAVAAGVIARQHAVNAQLVHRVDAMQSERDAVGERLLRLENIEKILRSQDSGELEALLAAAAPDNPGWFKPRTVERKDDPKDKSAARVDLARLLARVDANLAGVDNLRTKIDNRRLLLNFDLSNLSPQSALAGRGEVAVIGNDASISPVKDEKDDLAFQIQRFKQISTSFALPAKCDPKDLYGIRLTMADPSGKTIFSQVYPLSRE